MSDGTDIDFSSDLAHSEDTTVPAETGISVHGDDARGLNNQKPAPKTDDKPAPVKVDDKPAAEKPKSLRDTISSALKGELNTPDVGQKDGGPIRNPDGTFAPKAAEGTEQPVIDPNAAPAVAAPRGIDEQVFKALPAETQANLARTMEGIAQQEQRFAALAPIEQLIAPRVDAWALNGMAPAQALHQLFALSDFAGKDPPGFVKYFAQQSGIDLEQLVLDMDPDEIPDPKYSALEKEIAQLKEFNNSVTQQQQQAAHEAEVNKVVAFASEKGPDGKTLLRPYFEELGNSVLPFISAVKAANPKWSNDQVLQEAYDQACWGNPSIRAKMQASAQAADEAKRVRDAAARAGAARNASVSVRSDTPNSPSPAPDDPKRSLRDTIRASIAQASANA